MGGVSHNVDRYEVVFDDEGLVADGGLLAASTLVSRLGLEELVDDVVRLDGRVGGARPGRKTLTLVSAMLVGGSHIDHVDRLRAGSTHRVLSHEVMAPSTVGTFLRSFTWGHTRQLNKVLGVALGRAWAAGAGPGKRPLTLDLDSTICGVSGRGKEGASYGYTKELGYHSLLAFRADTGEAVGARLRAGASRRGVAHFAQETIRCARRAGARGRIEVRADSGFWSYAMLATLDHLGVGWSITCPQLRHVLAAIAAIDEDDWADIDYPEGGRAQVGETTLEMTNPRKRKQKRRVRLVVRRTRLTGAQQEFWPDWRYHAFVTNSHAPAPQADRHHRHHAVCELAIRDLKDSGGLAHLPSGRFAANQAWLLCAALAHNLYRWIAILGRTQPAGRLIRGRTIRTRIFGIPARVVNHSGRPILRLPARWPWAHTYQTTLANLRTLPQRC